MPNPIPSSVKQEILGKVKAGESVPALSKQYGVGDKTIYGWLRRGVVRAVSLLEYRKLKKENQTLKEIIGALTVELERTKKKIR